MDLAHRQAALLEPAAVDLAILRVPVSVRMALEVFQMEQREGWKFSFAMRHFSHGFSDKTRHLLRRPGSFSVRVLR
jgi:hypothetical protein